MAFRKYASDAERLLANSIPSEDSAHGGSRCWEWIGKRRTNRSGMSYPVLTLRYKSGPRRGKVYNMSAHRYSLVVFKGRRMTPRMVARHLCNNPLCINPEHLVGGSQKSNVRQCVREGRHKTPFRDPEKKAAQ